MEAASDIEANAGIAPDSSKNPPPSGEVISAALSVPNKPESLPLKKVITFRNIISESQHEQEDKTGNEQEDEPADHARSVPLRTLTSIRGQVHPHRGFREWLQDTVRCFRSALLAGEATKTPEKVEYDLKLEVLHRYNILASRAKLFRLLQADIALTDETLSQNVLRELSHYSRYH